MKACKVIILSAIFSFFFCSSKVGAQCSTSSGPSYSHSDEYEYYTSLSATGTGVTSTISYSYSGGSAYGPSVTYINDYASQGITASPGDAVSLTVHRYDGSYTAYLSVYVDWNNDGTYETTELAGTTATFSGTSHVYTFSIPATGATTGTNLHMRVFLTEGGTAPCSGTYGQAIDFYLNVNCAAPTLLVSPGSTAVCNGNSTTITASGATTYSWSPATGLSATTGAAVTATPATTTTYTVTGTTSGCSATDTTTIAVNTIGVSPANDGPACAGGTIHLSASDTGTAAPVTYAWSGPSGYSSTFAGPALSSITSGMAGVYTITASAPGTGCSATGTTTVTVNPQPSIAGITFSTPAPCIGGTLTLTANPGVFTDVTAYTWSGPGLSATVTSSPSETTVVTGSGIFTVTATDPVAGCITATATATFTAAGSPVLTGGASSNSPVCAGSILDLLAVTPVNVTSYSWAGPSAFTSTSQNPSISDVTTAASGAYSVTVYNGSGSGCIATYTTTATVNPLPLVYMITGGGSYCPGGSGVNISLSGSDAGVNYQLFNGSTASGTLFAGTGAAISFGLQTAPGTYVALATNAVTGCSDTMTDSVVVYINPVVYDSVYITSGLADTVCSGSLITYTATAVNGGSASYQWRINGLSAGGTGDTYTYMPSNGDVVSCTLTSSLPCAIPTTPSYSVTMSVVPAGMPAVTITAVPVYSVCEGSSVTFTPSVAFGGDSPVYSWIVNGADEGTGNTFSYYPANHDTVSCTLHSNYTCRLSDTANSNKRIMHVTAFPAPVAVILALPTLQLAYGQKDTLIALVTNGGDHTQYQWYINDTLMPGAISDTFISTDFRNNDSVSCLVTSNSLCGSIQTFNWVIINEFPAATQQLSATRNDIRLLPNPNNGSFSIIGTLSNTDEEVVLEITDVMGKMISKDKRTVLNGQLNEEVHFKGALANGAYLLHISAGSENRVIRFVVEN